MAKRRQSRRRYPWPRPGELIPHRCRVDPQFISNQGSIETNSLAVDAAGIPVLLVALPSDDQIAWRHRCDFRSDLVVGGKGIDPKLAGEGGPGG